MSNPLPPPESPQRTKSFGIDVNVNEDILALNGSSDSLANKVETLTNLVEEMHIVSRDNNAIVVDMLFRTEKKLNLKIDALREEMIALISARTNDNFSSATVLDKINMYKVEQTAALDGVKVAAAKNPTPTSTNTSHNWFSFSDAKTERPHSTERTPSPSFVASIAPPAVSHHEMIKVTPLPGFVIKTKRLLGQKEKAFINVFHHPQIELEPAGLPKEKLEDKPFIVIDEVHTTVDKEGLSSLMFNIAVSSEYFRQPNYANPKIADLTITSPLCVQKIIHKINLKFGEYLDEGNYVLPRLTLGYKGESIPIFTIPVHVEGGARKPPLAVAAGSAAIPRTSVTTIPEETALEAVSSDKATTGGKPPVYKRTTPTITGTSLSDIPLVTDTYSSEPNSPTNLPPVPPFPSNDNNNVIRRVSDASMDNSSVISDITHDTTDGSQRTHKPMAKRGSGTGSSSGHGHSFTGKPHRKSIFDTSAMAFNGGAIAGRNLLSGTMLDYIREECVDGKTADEVKEESGSNPGVLLGWQINIEPSGKSDEKASGLYVVTDMRKNLMSKTEFKISRYHQDDQWIRLQRKEGKSSGYDFRPMRKVLFGLADDDDDDNSHAI